METSPRTDWKLAIGLIGLGVVARLLPHPPNVTPFVGLALFAGARLAPGWGIALPVAAAIISDLFLGLHDVVAFTWLSIALIGMLGWRLRGERSTGRVAGSSIAASTLFFLVSNVGVWLLGERGTMYAKTLQGLWTCYVAALPFYRNALVGDLIYTLGIFAVYDYSLRRQLVRSPVSVRGGHPSHASHG